MKYSFYKSSHTLTAFLVLVFLFPVFTSAQNKFEQPIPVDEKVKIGKFKNGFTYYIRKNSKPENRMELRLVVKAGSVLEEDDQQGLAHFIEHMAFNGTKNFAKNELVNYLQSAGVQFGPEINAYTSLDETVYMLTLPVDSPEIVTRGFQIMEDWAHNLSLDAEEIDKERGVVIEEWRMGQGPNQRMQEKLFPVLFSGSKYANRLPIGKKEVIENASHETIRKFYHDWYRPDLMALIVVGDIDPAAMEKLIVKHFEPLTNPVPEKPRTRFGIPDVIGTSTALASDKEMPYTAIQIAFKGDPLPQVFIKDYREMLKIQLATSILNQRITDLKEQADPPLLMSAVQYSSLGTREKNALQMIGIVAETGIERGITALITEAERAMRYGFTKGELDRQKRHFYTVFETSYNERDKNESENLAAELVRNFLTDECIPGIEFEYIFVKEYLDGISLEEINTLTGKLLSHNNRVVMVMAPDKEGIVLPAENQILSLVNEAERAEIKAYVDKFSGNSLMSELPAKGRIILTKNNSELGVSEMALSNGARVILKPTDFKNDEVLFTAFSAGGYSLYGVSDHESAVYAADAVANCGLAGYSPNDLNKLLAGKVVTINPYIDTYFEGMNGSSKPSDLETMLQLVYLGFTRPRKDTLLFNSFVIKQKGVVRNLLSDPENYFSDQYNRAKAQNHELGDYIPTPQTFDNVNINRVFDIYRDRFSDASGFTFLLVGSFKIDSIKPLIETYLASLPSTRKEESWKDMGIRPPSVKQDIPVYKGHDPKSIVALYAEAEETWEPFQDHLYSSLSEYLEIRYNEVLREEMSGIYGMGVDIDLVKIPYNHIEVSLYIPCSPDKTEELTKAAINEIEKVKSEGVSNANIIKVREAQRRLYESNMKLNGYWISQLSAVYKFNEPRLITEKRMWIDNVTSDNLRQAASKIPTDRFLRLTLYPENK